MIQQQIQTSQPPALKFNFLKSNSAFHVYKKENQVQPSQELRSTTVSTEGHQESTECSQSSIQKSQILPRSKIYKKKAKHAPYKSETKNIPKNFGVLLKKYLCSLQMDNAAVKSFLKNGDQKKNFSRQDFTRLFNDEVACQMSRQYFSGFQIIHDLMISEKIQDVKNHLKYISKFFNSTYNDQELAQLKLQ